MFNCCGYWISKQMTNFPQVDICVGRSKKLLLSKHPFRFTLAFSIIFYATFFLMRYSLLFGFLSTGTYPDLMKVAKVVPSF